MLRLPPSPLPLALAALLAPGLAAQAATDPWPAFAKLPTARQQAAAAAFVAALPTAPAVAALRAFAAAADAPTKPRLAALAAQRPKRAVEFPGEADPLRRRVDYVFGLGTVEPRGAAPAKAAKPKPAAGKAAGGASPNPTAADPVVLQQAQAGLVPDADKALAGLLLRLDAEPAGDAFAAFLQSWRNGDESFYEALDRTAGTTDSVFFYDVMLGDFRVRFGKGDAKVHASLQRAHDALHDAFLSYRQYRGFREAVAWSLVLPPDMPLPTRLARYEAKAAGAYSLREQVTMVAAAMDHDLAALVDVVVQSAPPLPQPLWAAAYDPYPPWTAHFQSLQARMIERDGSTDAFLAKAIAAQRELAGALQAQAVAALAAAAAAQSH